MRITYQCPIPHDDGTETVYDVTADHTPAEKQTRDHPGWPAELEVLFLKVGDKRVLFSSLSEADAETITDAGWEAVEEVAHA